MVRYALIEIRDPDSWFLLQTIVNELFDCAMINHGDPKRDSKENPTGHIIFTGINKKGLKFLNKYGDDLAEYAKEYREGKKH